nr:immunoglobulin light chain junction region [Macaca mulatta]MOW31645.1 immunoglobulin light chain junction region [Macaca mulatta]MOW31778.1 immunoglobulin light chain junction region [Macaca mulatta]
DYYCSSYTSENTWVF